MKLHERLKIARESLGYDQKTMAKSLEIGHRSWQGYESGSHYPGGEVFEALARMGFNVNWLLTGEGKMWREGFGPELDRMVAAAERVAAINDMIFGKPSQREEPVQTDSGFDSKNYVQVPRFEVSASAGGGAVVQSEQVVDFIGFKEEWIRNSLGASARNLALITVKGDSMEPTLSDGDLVLVDTSAKDIEVNAIYVIQFWGSLLVKRIQRKIDGSVVIKSDNTVYEPEVVTGELVNQLNVVGRVVWYGRRA